MFIANMDLFEQSIAQKFQQWASLSERLRPQNLSEVLNLDQAKGGRELLRYFKQAKKSPNIILTGPPGCGKTSIGRLIAEELGMVYLSLNAVDSGVKDIRQAAELAKEKWLSSRSQLLVFVDEVHRFSKSQQDVLLPFIERGEFILVGATTENPFYFLNRALLSRCRILELSPLDESAMRSIFERALGVLGRNSQKWTEGVVLHLIHRSRGDARSFLNELETLFELTKDMACCNEESVLPLLSQTSRGVQSDGDYFYDLLSAMIKSIRHSEVDAALLYSTELLEGGVDPRVVARRLVISASEDIGNGDPRALPLAVAASQAVEIAGMPESAIILSQVVCYLSSAPKSNRSYQALRRTQALLETSNQIKIPDHLKNRPIVQSAKVNSTFWPDNIESVGPLYEPASFGFEKQILEYQKWTHSQKR